jgi:YD repeat-containing protein
VLSRPPRTGTADRLRYDTAGQLTGVTQTGHARHAGHRHHGLARLRRRRQPHPLVDGNGNDHDLHLQPWNLPESTIEPSTTAHPAAADRTWTNKYDAAGRHQQVLPGSVTRASSYDNLGRLTGETATGATTTARSLDYDQSDASHAAPRRPATTPTPGTTAGCWPPRPGTAASPPRTPMTAKPR